RQFRVQPHLQHPGALTERIPVDLSVPRRTSMRSLSKDARALAGPACGLLLALAMATSAGSQGAQPAPAQPAEAADAQAAQAAPAPPPPLAERVIASVNDDIISSYDLDQRIRL